MPINWNATPTLVGAFVNRPTAPSLPAGVIYIASDTGHWYRTDEVTWTDITTLFSGASGTGSIAYVTTTGSDANDGLSWGSPKLTVQAALDALPDSGGRVCVAAGTYPITTTIILDSDQWLDLHPSATIILATNANCPIIKNRQITTGNDRIRVTGGVLDGNKANQNGVPSDASHVGLLFYRVNDSILDGVTVRNCKDKGFYVRGSDASVYGERVHITRCWSINNSGFAFALYGNFTEFIGNYTYRTETIDADSFNVGGNHCILIGNIAYNSVTAGAGDGFAVEGLNYGLIEGNQIINFANGVRFYNLAGGTVGCRVIGNRLRGAGTSGLYGGQYGIVLPTGGASYFDISGNHIENFGALATGYGIFIGDGPCQVHDNDVSGSGGTNRVPFSVDTTITTCYRYNNYGAGIVGGMPSCAVRHDAAQAIPSAAQTALAFNTEVEDSDRMHDPASNTRITAQTAGLYQLSAGVVFAAAAGGVVRLAGIRKNGTTLIAQSRVPFDGAETSAISLSTTDRAISGDYYEVVVYQDSGGAVNVTVNGNYSPEFRVRAVTY